jgi:hypothetical protein
MFLFEALRVDTRNAWRLNKTAHVVQIHWDVRGNLHVYVDDKKGAMDHKDLEASNWQGGIYNET